MANEISYQVQLSLRNGTLTDQYASGSKTANQVTAALVRNVQTVSTGAGGDALDLGSLATPPNGWACFINMDAANYIEIGSFVGGTFYPFLRLKFGEIQMIRLANIAPYGRANTAPVKLFYIIYEA